MLFSAHAFLGTVSTHIFQVQFQHTSTHTFQLQFQHTQFSHGFNTHISTCSFNKHISDTVSTHTFQRAVSTHTFQMQFQHTHSKRSFSTHISTSLSTHTFQLQFHITFISLNLIEIELRSQKRNIQKPPLSR